MWSIHTVEYYSALKRKDILTHATTQTNPEDIMLSEISQSQKDKPVGLHLYEVGRVIKIIGTKGRMVVAGDWGRGKGA